MTHIGLESCAESHATRSVVSLSNRDQRKKLVEVRIEKKKKKTEEETVKKKSKGKESRSTSNTHKTFRL